jgi:hypothetical protein
VKNTLQNIGGGVNLTCHHIATILMLQMAFYAIYDLSFNAIYDLSMLLGDSYAITIQRLSEI